MIARLDTIPLSKLKAIAGNVMLDLTVVRRPMHVFHVYKVPTLRPLPRLVRIVLWVATKIKIVHRPVSTAIMVSRRTWLVRLPVIRVQRVLLQLKESLCAFFVKLVNMHLLRLLDSVLLVLLVPIPLLPHLSVRTVVLVGIILSTLRLLATIVKKAVIKLTMVVLHVLLVKLVGSTMKLRQLTVFCVTLVTSRMTLAH
jgi:hypothetical protein